MMAVSWLSRCSAIALLETRAAEHASCKLAAVCLVGGHTQHQRTRAWLHRHHHCLLQHHHLHLLVQGAVQPSHRTKATHSAAATASAVSVGVASTHTRYMATTTLAKPPPRTRPRPASSSADTDWVHKPRRHHGVTTDSSSSHSARAPQHKSSQPNECDAPLFFDVIITQEARECTHTMNRRLEKLRSRKQIVADVLSTCRASEGSTF